MRLILDAPYPRQNLPRFGWLVVLITGCAVLGLASQGWFAASYTAGGAGSAALLYFVMRGEVGPTAWAAWSVEPLVERVCTAGALTAVRLGYAVSATTDRGSAIVLAKTRATVDQRTCDERERRSALAIRRRFHGVAHVSLLRARLTSMRAATAAR